MQGLAGREAGQHVADRFGPCGSSLLQHLEMAALEVDPWCKPHCDRRWDREGRRTRRAVDDERDEQHRAGNRGPVSTGADAGSRLIQATLESTDAALGRRPYGAWARASPVEDGDDDGVRGHGCEE